MLDASAAGRLLPHGAGLRTGLPTLACLLPLAVHVQRRSRPTGLDEAVLAAGVPLPAPARDVLDLAARGLPPSMPLVGLALAVLCWHLGGRRAAALCLLGPIAASLSTATAKPLLARPSASGEGWMFPSGHVTAVAAVCVVAGVLLLPHGLLTTALGRHRWTARAVVLALPLATATGTVVHRYHHPTDVAGAVLVALASVLLVAAVIDRLPRPGVGRCARRARR